MLRRAIKQSIDAQNDVKSLLESSALAFMITGQIRNNMRVLNSSKEDIIITTLFWDADQIQSGIITINIFVPNLIQQVGNSVDRTQPNIPRYLELSSIVVGVLDDYHGDDFSLTLRNPGKLETNGTESLYNIEVNYIFLRTDL